MRPRVKNRGEVCITNSQRIKVENLAKGLKSGNHSLALKKTNDLGYRSHGPLVIDVIEMVLFLLQMVASYHLFYLSRLHRLKRVCEGLTSTVKERADRVVKDAQDWTEVSNATYRYPGSYVRRLNYEY